MLNILNKSQLLLAVGAKLEHIITRLAQEIAETPTDDQAARLKPSDQRFWFHRPAIVLYVIHFILFQNAFEIAFFFWIWVSTKQTLIFDAFGNSH